MKKLRLWLENSSDVNQKLENLKDKMKSLIARQADVLTEIENAEIQPGKIRRMEVVHWLAKVEENKVEVQSIEMEGQQQLLVSSHSLHSRIQKITKNVEELLQQGRFPNGLILNDYKRRALPFQVTELVGEMFQKNVETIMGWLKLPMPIFIGVCGMGGVGKTTLLKHIYNSLLADSSIAGHVHWVTVSQDCCLYKLQHKISLAVGMDLSHENDENKRAALLNYALGRMGKNVIILDDVWESFMVNEVGIPHGEKNWKIILSTRNQGVCLRMGSYEEFVVQVKPLSKNEAWNLFVEWLLNYKALATEVKQIAASVAEECSGLPLAIITVAVSMRGIFKRNLWKNALDELRNPSRGQHDMENCVFPKLKFSYDHLSDKVLQSCFLSCVLYPEDYKIQREELINIWIAEGQLDEIQGRQEQLNKGHTILNKLVNSCLLESTTDQDNIECVKMHDLIRQMAIIITLSHPRFMVKSGLLLKEVPEERHWTEDLVKVSLRENSIAGIPCDVSPWCPELSVLMLCHNPLMGIPESLFVHMRALTVLDLSATCIQRVPDSVSKLENLRALLLGNCGNLKYVPSLAKLTKLRLLDLPPGGKIDGAPRGMERLGCLEQITFCEWNMSDLTYFNRLIESWQFSRLCCYRLWLCDMRYSYQDFSRAWLHSLSYSFPRLSYNIELEDYDRKLVISWVELRQKEPSPLLPHTTQLLALYDSYVEGRRSLTDVFPSLSDATELMAILILHCSGLDWIWSAAQQEYLPIFPQFDTLEMLDLRDLPQLKGLVKIGGGDEMMKCLDMSMTYPQGAAMSTFSHLRRLSVHCCPKMKVLFQVELLQHQPLLPMLEEIYVSNCKELEEIFESGGGSKCTSSSRPKDDDLHADIRGSDVIVPILALPNLWHFVLENLPELGCIYKGLLFCTSLGSIDINRCPKLDMLRPLQPLISDASPSTLGSMAKTQPEV